MPADLRPVGGPDAAAERGRECLAPEADPEHRDAAFVRSAQQVKLRGQPAADPVMVVSRPDRAHRHDHVEGGRVGEANLDARIVEPVRRHDEELGDVVAALGEPLPH